MKNKILLKIVGAIIILIAASIFISMLYSSGASWIVIGLISNIILFVFGIRGLLINEPIPFVSYLFTIGGLIGIIALLLELKKRNTAESSNSEQI